MVNSYGIDDTEICKDYFGNGDGDGSGNGDGFGYSSGGGCSSLNSIEYFSGGDYERSNGDGTGYGVGDGSGESDGTNDDFYNI